jgi:hypothetical protein
MDCLHTMAGPPRLQDDAARTGPDCDARHILYRMLACCRDISELFGNAGPAQSRCLATPVWDRDVSQRSLGCLPSPLRQIRGYGMRR